MFGKNTLPNSLSLGNLFCGCLAAKLAAEGALTTAVLFVCIGLILDFFDGFAARLLRVDGALGKQLDSLADMVTFGLVPGLFMYALLDYSLAGGNPYLPYLGFVITLCAALRLAKFSVDARQSDYFFGLPTPAGTLYILSLFLILRFQSTPMLERLLSNFYFLSLNALLVSALMLLDIKLFSLKIKTLKWHGNELRYSFLLLSAGLLFLFHFLAIPLILALYVIVSTVTSLRSFRNWLD